MLNMKTPTTTGIEMSRNEETILMTRQCLENKIQEELSKGNWPEVDSLMKRYKNDWPSSEGIVWQDVDFTGCSREGFLEVPQYTLQEAVRRIKKISKQSGRPVDRKVNFHFTGLFKGEAFTLYEYCNSGMIHIGCRRGTIDASELAAALTKEMERV